MDGKLSYHMSGPSRHSWIAVGTGSEMQDSMMFVLYSTGTGNSKCGTPVSLALLSSRSIGKIHRTDWTKGSILSTRYSTGEQEPKYLSHLEPESTASNENGILSVDAHYENSSTWMQDHIDMSSTKQPFIFALGPKLHDQVDDSPTAMIQRHVVYGRFTMDMTKAVSSTAPEANGENGAWKSNGASSAFGVSSDFDAGSAIHAVLMCLAFVFGFPLGAILLRFLSVRVHYLTQVAASILVIVGVGSGIYISMEYNKVSLRVKLYNTC